MHKTDRFYEIVANEIAENRIDRMTWTKAFAQSDGTNEAARKAYIRYRVSDLIEGERAACSTARRDRRQERRRRTDAEFAKALPVSAIVSFLVLAFGIGGSKQEGTEFFRYLLWLLPPLVYAVVRGLIVADRRNRQRLG